MKKTFTFSFAICMILLGCGKDNGWTDDGNAQRMQRFVIDISNYARSIKPEFIVIPQNGPELAFNNTEPADGMMIQYIHAIDGLGIEELFYDGALSVDLERLSMLRILKPSLKIMVSDYLSHQTDITDAILRNRNEGFISFPRSVDNYHYGIIPTGYITDENDDNILVLADAKNYLYLISTDNFASKDDLLTTISATNYDLVIIDLFFGDTPFTAEEINRIAIKKGGARRLIVAYVNIGSAENWRFYWDKDWRIGNPSWLKRNYTGYPNEIWVEYWNEEWQRIIYGNEDSYLRKVLDAGFDGVYLDNVEAYFFLNHAD